MNDWRLQDLANDTVNAIEKLTSKITELETEIDDLNNSIVDKDDEIGSYVREIDDRDNIIDSLNEKIGGFSDNLLAAKRRVEFLEEENSRLQILYDQQEMRLDESMERITDIEKYGYNV